METILVVDDDRAIRYIVSKFLSKWGFQVLTAEHGGEGLDLCRRNAVDLVITDLIMPVKTGLELIEDLRRECPEVKIVAISSSQSDSGLNLLDKARHLGADITLQKPVLRRKLLEIVRELLGNYEKIRA